MYDTETPYNGISYRVFMGTYFITYKMNSYGIGVKERSSSDKPLNSVAVCGFFYHSLESRTRLILTAYDGQRRWDSNLRTPACEPPLYHCATDTASCVWSHLLIDKVLCWTSFCWSSLLEFWPGHPEPRLRRLTHLYFFFLWCLYAKFDRGVVTTTTFEIFAIYIRERTWKILLSCNQ